MDGGNKNENERCEEENGQGQMRGGGVHRPLPYSVLWAPLFREGPPGDGQTFPRVAVTCRSLGYWGLHAGCFSNSPI